MSAPKNSDVSNDKRLPGKNVRSPALVFEFGRIRFTLDYFLNCETCRLDVSPDLRGLKKEKVHRYRMTPQFLFMSCTNAHVEGEEKRAARLQHSVHFAQHYGQQFIWK